MNGSNIESDYTNRGHTLTTRDEFENETSFF